MDLLPIVGVLVQSNFCFIWNTHTFSQLCDAEIIFIFTSVKAADSMHLKRF